MGVGETCEAVEGLGVCSPENLAGCPVPRREAPVSVSFEAKVGPVGLQEESWGLQGGQLPGHLEDNLLQLEG